MYYCLLSGLCYVRHFSLVLFNSFHCYDAGCDRYYQRNDCTLPIFLILSRQRADFHSQAQHLEVSTFISKIYDIGHDRKLEKNRKRAALDKAVTIWGSNVAKVMGWESNFSAVLQRISHSSPTCKMEAAGILSQALGAQSLQHLRSFKGSCYGRAMYPLFC